MNDGTLNDASILTPDQRLRVFVSSTLEELADERSSLPALQRYAWNATSGEASISAMPSRTQVGNSSRLPAALWRTDSRTRASRGLRGHALARIYRIPMTGTGFHVATRADARTIDGMEPGRVVTSLAIAAAAASLLVACGGSGTAKPSATSSGSSSSASSGSAVKIANFAFSPGTLTVAGGARVTVRNDDSTAHTVTADDGHSFDTGAIDPGSSSTVTAPKPGRYTYHCSIHPFMHGTLVVR